MSDSAFTDTDPSVYKTHVLYVLAGDANCGKLLTHLETHGLNDEVYVQDAGELKQRPPWLDGVPILINKSTNQAHKGRNIYKYLAEWKSDDFMPAGSSIGGYASFEHNGEEEFGNSNAKKFASLYDNGMFSMEDEGETAIVQPTAAKGARDQRRSEAQNEAQLATQRLQEARNLQDQRAARAAPPPPQQYRQQQPPPQQYRQPQQAPPSPPPQQQQYYSQPQQAPPPQQAQYYQQQPYPQQQAPPPQQAQYYQQQAHYRSHQPQQAPPPQQAQYYQQQAHQPPQQQYRPQQQYMPPQQFLAHEQQQQYYQ